MWARKVYGYRKTEKGRRGMTESETKELLLLVAKAAGYNVKWNDSWYAPFRGFELDGRSWKPHTDDGDSARLRTKLYLSAIVTDCHARASGRGGPYSPPYSVPHNNTEDSKNAALRLATLKCAAEIGRMME